MSARKKAGRPKYRPTDADRNTVLSMAACGFSQDAIASCIGTDGITAKTLRKHFESEIQTAAHKANAKIGQVAFSRASAGEAWAVCFWLKCRAGWRETAVVEHTGKDGQSLTNPLSDVPTQNLVQAIQLLSVAPKADQV